MQVTPHLRPSTVLRSKEPQSEPVTLRSRPCLTLWPIPKWNTMNFDCERWDWQRVGCHVQTGCSCSAQHTRHQRTV